MTLLGYNIASIPPLPKTQDTGMAVLRARVDDETKRRFTRLSERRKITESELLRRLVVEALDQKKGEGSADLDEALEQGDVELKQLTIRLAAFLMTAAKGRAKAKGMAPSRWIAALVQSNLTKTPVLTDKELVALRAVNRELAAIGRNVNQIAKHLNSAFYENERANLDALTQVPRVIESAKRAIRDLVKASKQGWAGDE